MAGPYKIFEKLPNGELVFVEKAENLEQAKMRFLSLSSASDREYLLWDTAKGYEVVFKSGTTS